MIEILSAISTFINGTKLGLKIKEIIKNRELQILVHVRTEAISPTAAKLFLEIENKSSFDIYDLKFDLNNMLTDDFFLCPSIVTAKADEAIKLSEIIDKTTKLSIELDNILKFIKRNKSSESLYGENLIKPYVHLLNIYKEQLEDDYSSTIKHFDNSYKIENKIESQKEIKEFSELLQHINIRLLSIGSNLNKYDKSIKNHIGAINKIKSKETIIVPIITFQFFVFDDEYSNKKEIQFSSKEKLDMDLKYKVHANNTLKNKQIIIKDIQIDPVSTKFESRAVLERIYESMLFKEWQSRLSKEHEERFYQIKLAARNDVNVFIRFNNIKALKDASFFGVYQTFMELLDDELKTTQIVFSM